MKPNLFLVVVFLSSFFQARNAHAQQALPVISGSEELRILSWNIFMLPLSLFPKSGQLERAEAIVEQLKNSAYDVVVFQEAFEKKARQILREGLSETFPFQAGPGENGFLKFNSGVWILSKFEFSLIESIRFNTCRVADCMSKKGAILVELAKNGKLFQIVGTHLQAENFPEVRKQQFIDIYQKLLKPFEKENVPQFIAGDLNTPFDDKENYVEMLDLLQAEDHAPRLRKSALKELITWGGEDNDLFAKDSKRTPQLLDYILIRHNGKKPAWIERTIEIFRQAWNFDKSKKDLSDHYAVAAVIRY